MYHFYNQANRKKKINQSESSLLKMRLKRYKVSSKRQNCSNNQLFINPTNKQTRLRSFEA